MTDLPHRKFLDEAARDAGFSEGWADFSQSHVFTGTAKALAIAHARLLEQHSPPVDDMVERVRVALDVTNISTAEMAAEKLTAALRKSGVILERLSADDALEFHQAIKDGSLEVSKYRTYPNERGYVLCRAAE